MSTPDSQQPQHSDYDEKVSVVSEHAAAAATREKPDPKVGLEPASLWVFLIACVALIIGAGYLGGTNGGWSNDTYTYVEGYTVPPVESDRVLGPQLSPGEKWLKDGKRQYGNCAVCHMSNGIGQAGAIPPLANSEWVYGGSERLAAILLNGMNGPITVDGAVYNSNMVAWAAMSDTEIAQVMSYIRTSWGNAEKLAEGDNGLISADMVKEARRKHVIPGLKVSDLDGIDGNLPGPQLDPETLEPIDAAAE